MRHAVPWSSRGIVMQQFNPIDASLLLDIVYMLAGAMQLKLPDPVV